MAQLYCYCCHIIFNSVPGPVQSLEVVSINNNSVHVSWKPPQNSTFVTQYSLMVQRWDGQGIPQVFTILATQELLTQVVSALGK